MLAGRRLFIAGLLALFAAPAGAQRPRPLTVFAAASLTDALQEVGRAYRARTGQAVRFSFAASGTVARQVRAGTGADLVMLADPAWMDALATAGRLEPGTRRDLLGGRLALIAPRGSRVALPIRSGFPIGRALGERGRLAIGDPASVPAGRYARAALTRLGVWRQVVGRLAPAADVRAALAYVARGETPLGVVYESDAAAERAVRVVGLFPAGSHPPITYPAAVVRGAGPDAGRFLRYLSGGEARAIFMRHRFRSL